MRGLFNKLEIKSRNTLSKQEKKKINNFVGKKLDLKDEYKILCTSNKLKIILGKSHPVYFEYYDKIYPTIFSFDKSYYKTIVLDSGAIEPLKRGANVMCPGVLKYLELSDKFEKDEIVGIEIINHGIIGIGFALASYDDVIQQKEGAVVEMLHIEDDALYSNSLV